MVLSARSLAFGKANEGLGINQHFCEKGRPWQNLIESQFGIQARLGEYLWRNCSNTDQAIDIHRELIRDHNRLPHFAHRKREDGKDSPWKCWAIGAARKSITLSFIKPSADRFGKDEPMRKALSVSGDGKSILKKACRKRRSK
jgi:hypothetical protein